MPIKRSIYRLIAIDGSIDGVTFGIAAMTSQLEMCHKIKLINVLFKIRMSINEEEKQNTNEKF